MRLLVPDGKTGEQGLNICDSESALVYDSDADVSGSGFGEQKCRLCVLIFVRAGFLAGGGAGSASYILEGK